MLAQPSVKFPVAQESDLLAETLTPVVEVPASNGAVYDEPVFAPLTVAEDTFALAVIEYSGNLKKAYLSVWPYAANPAAKARNLIANPAIAARIQQITASVQDGALMSLGAHLIELADIRDMAKAMGAPKVALEAEKSRGEVAGFYAGKGTTAGVARGKGENDNPMVVIQINTPHDRDI
jgi:hypothetical protein